MVDRSPSHSTSRAHQVDQWSSGDGGGGNIRVRKEAQVIVVIGSQEALRGFCGGRSQEQVKRGTNSEPRRT